jgi:hypothetical protein
VLVSYGNFEISFRRFLGDHFPVMLLQYGFGVIGLFCRPDETVQRHRITAEGMAQAVGGPLEAVLLLQTADLPIDAA